MPLQLKIIIYKQRVIKVQNKNYVFKIVDDLITFWDNKYKYYINIKIHISILSTSY